MRNRLKIDFNSIRTRITVLFLSAGALILLVTAFSAFKIFETTLVDEIGNNRSDVLSQIGERVRQVKNNAYLVSNLYYYDGKLKTLMEEFQEDGTPKAEQALLEYLGDLDAQYKKSLYGNDLDYEVHLILENGWGYDSSAPDKMERGLNPKYKVWYKDILRAGGTIVDVANYRDKAARKDYYCAARTIFCGDGEPEAYLVIAVDERKLYDVYCRVVSGDGVLYLVDQEGTVISSSNEKIRGFNFFNMANLDKLFANQEYIITRMHGDDILFTRYVDEETGFTVLEEIKLETLLAPVKRVRFAIMLIVLATLAIVTACAYIMAGHVTKPLLRLCEFIQQIDGDRLMERCGVRGYTEINILSEKVNFLLAKIQVLLDRIRQKEQQKRKMEISFLQAQINPHFMYNTLFSVKCMVDMKKNREAAAMLDSFIRLLQSTLSNPNEFETIEKEFEELREYAKIQKFRYNDSFQAVFECGEGAGSKKIPKLLIQPLVENAIFHGVELRSGDGLIIVVARLSGENLVITVEDNGVGIPPETMERINRGENVSEKTQIGILNIRERIQLNFGSAYGLKIESVQWRGTKITMTLPAIE